jgi:hypothetical protein
LFNILGPTGIKAWRRVIKVNSGHEARKHFHECQAVEHTQNIMRMADDPLISASPGSFARVRIKRVGLECEADKKIVKPFDGEMKSLLGAPFIIKKEEMMLVDLVVNKCNTKRLELVEKKVTAHINKKMQLAAAMIKENDECAEMSAM